MSMTKSEVLALAKRIGAEDSANLQARASTMDGTALIAEEAKIISFEAAKRNANMLTRERGFVCTYGGQVYQLDLIMSGDGTGLQPYLDAMQQNVDTLVEALG